LCLAKEAAMRESISLQFLVPKTIYQALKRAAKKTNRSESELVLAALRAYLDNLAKVDPFLGMFANEAEMIDDVVSYAMKTRESTPLRIHEGK